METLRKAFELRKGKKRPIGYVTPGGYKKTNKGWIKVRKQGSTIKEKKEKQSSQVSQLQLPSKGILAHMAPEDLSAFKEAVAQGFKYNKAEALKAGKDIEIGILSDDYESYRDALSDYVKQKYPTKTMQRAAALKDSGLPDNVIRSEYDSYLDYLVDEKYNDTPVKKLMEFRMQDVAYKNWVIAQGLASAAHEYDIFGNKRRQKAVWHYTGSTEGKEGTTPNKKKVEKKKSTTTQH